MSKVRVAPEIRLAIDALMASASPEELKQIDDLKARSVAIENEINDFRDNFVGPHRLCDNRSLNDDDFE